MNCSNCGAALPPHSDVCEYCHAVNDTDLGRLKAERAVWSGDTPSICPRCEVHLKGFEIKAKETYGVERCDTCLGMFFSPMKRLDSLLDVVVPQLSRVDFQRLTNFVEQSKPDQWEVAYIPCPVCKKLMNRKIYGQYSGVVVDWCRDHGVWLDGGELGKLIRWARAGGRQADRETQMLERKKKKRKALAIPSLPVTGSSSYSESPFWRTLGEVFREVLENL